MKEEYYTVKEYAQLYRLAEVTVRQWIQHKKIKSIKIGGRRLILKNQDNED